MDGGVVAKGRGGWRLLPKEEWGCKAYQQGAATMEVVSRKLATGKILGRMATEDECGMVT